MLAVRDDGLAAGSVSGGCIEDDLDRAHAPRRHAADALRRRHLRRQRRRGAALRTCRAAARSSSCSSRCTRESGIRALLREIEAGHLSRAGSTSRPGRATLHPARATDGLAFDGSVLTTIHGPRYRMLVIGASQLSKYLAQIAVGLDYQVTVCDPREEYTETWDVPGVTLVRTMPDDTVHGDEARRALCGRRADARSEARRPRADGGAEVARVLRRRARARARTTRSAASGCANSI